MLLVVLVCSTWLSELSVSHFAISRYRPVGIHALLAQANDTDAVVHLAREDMLVRGRWQAENCGSKASSSVLRFIDLPHLVLLVFHIVDEHLLMSAHILNDEIIGCVRKVPSRRVTVSGRGPRLTTLTLVV